MTKKKDKSNKPASQLQVVKFGQNTSSRKYVKQIKKKTSFLFQMSKFEEKKKRKKEKKNNFCSLHLLPK